jgi:hypothetical protein
VYPFATIAFYGPDNRRASKVVVAVFTRDNAQPDPMRRWVSGKIDVRDNKKIRSEIQAFLMEHEVKKIVTTNTIIGCPHEEGLDYPVGTRCPFCPFWLNRDRFTHEVEK